MSAVGRAVDFHNGLGRDRVDARVRELAAQLKAKLQQRVPTIKFHTPVDPSMSAGIVIFTLSNLDPPAAATTLYEKHQITCAVSGGEFAGLRFAPHVYVLMDDIEKAAGAVASLATA